MGELAQLLWWQQLKWRRLRWLQQLQARGFGGGGARGLGFAVRTPARGPGCRGGACKNPRGASDGLTERAGVRGQRARSEGLRCALGCGRRAGRSQTRCGEVVAALFLPPARAGAPLSSLLASWGDPHAGAGPGLGARGPGARIPCLPPHPTICSAPPRPEVPHPQRLVPGSGMAAGPLSWDVSPRVTRPFWVLHRGRRKVRRRSPGLGLRSPALGDLGQVPSPLWASLFPSLQNDGLDFKLGAWFCQEVEGNG